VPDGGPDGHQATQPAAEEVTDGADKHLLGLVQARRAISKIWSDVYPPACGISSSLVEEQAQPCVCNLCGMRLAPV
jgi:hypothetical protein